MEMWAEEEEKKKIVKWKFEIMVLCYPFVGFY
jgi:hypothetical protein